MKVLKDYGTGGMAWLQKVNVQEVFHISGVSEDHEFAIQNIVSFLKSWEYVKGKPLLPLLITMKSNMAYNMKFTKGKTGCCSCIIYSNNPYTYGCLQIIFVENKLVDVGEKSGYYDVHLVNDTSTFTPPLALAVIGVRILYLLHGCPLTNIKDANSVLPEFFHKIVCHDTYNDNVIYKSFIGMFIEEQYTTKIYY